MVSFAPISGAPIAARDLDYVAAAGVTGTVTLGQGSQSVVATGTVTDTATVTLGQGSQSVTAIGTVSDAVTPAPGSQPGRGSGGGGLRVSFEDADRIRKRLRDIETKRRKTWGDRKKFERQIEQIYADLYERHPEEVELIAPALSGQVTESATLSAPAFTKINPLILDNLGAIRRLLDLYQTYLDDEEAVALLLLV